jgi:hypothetical protein
MSLSEWARAEWESVSRALGTAEAKLAQAMALREGRVLPPPPVHVAPLPLSRARGTNGKMVLVRCLNRAERRAAARFERRTHGVSFAVVFHSLTIQYRKARK